jgi:uncharacterized delta-60 repeat protein
VARHFEDGRHDPSFKNSVLTGHEATDGALQSDGKLLICGVIRNIQWETGDSIFRLNSDGSIDNTFQLHQAGYSGGHLLKLDSQERIISDPSAKNMQSHPFSVFRFTPQGLLDPTFQPQPANSRFFPLIGAVAVQANDKVLIAWNGETGKKLYRAHEDGSLDETFSAAPPDGIIRCILPLPDCIIAAGEFKRWGEDPVPGIVRLDYSGKLDRHFYHGGETAGKIYTLLQMPDGDLLVGGNFTSFNGRDFSSLVKLPLYPISIQHLNVAGSAINFSLFGATNRITVVEQSTDLISWSPIYRTNILQNPHSITLNLDTASIRFLRARNDP